MIAINLIDYVNVLKNLDDESIDLWLKQYGFYHAQNKGLERKDMVQFIQLFKGKPYEFFDGFYPGFSIPRIGKEFDLLRIGKDSIVNIELKHQSTEEKIRNQLLKNRYYLNFFRKKIYMFTYVADSGKLYTLDDSFHETSFLELNERLEEQRDLFRDDISRLFNVNAFLISPSRQAEDFKEHRYFLTTQQNSIKKEIRNILEQSSSCEFILIRGEAGTGKSLLLYDMAKDLEHTMIMCGNGISKGHRLLREAGLNIISVDEYELLRDADCSILFVDKGAHIRKEYFEKILQIVKERKISCIIGYDPCQVSVHNTEILSLFEQYRTHDEYTLSSNIRISENIISFIRNMFDLNNRPKKRVRFSSIRVQYYSDFSELREYCERLQKEEWKIIDFSGVKGTARYDADEEYARAVVIVADQLCYNGNKLSCTDESSDLVSQLYQAMTRVRDEMIVIVVNNKKLFRKCVSIVTTAG